MSLEDFALTIFPAEGERDRRGRERGEWGGGVIEFNRGR